MDLDLNKKLKNVVKTTIEGVMNESISKSEFDNMKNYLKNGGGLKNDVVGYHIFIRKDGERVFDINGNYKFFKDEDSFIRAAIRMIKRGY